MSCTVVKNNGKFNVKDCNGNLIKTCDTEDEANALMNEHNNNPDIEPEKPYEPTPQN